jgi:hypothetical protein
VQALATGSVHGGDLAITRGVARRRVSRRRAEGEAGYRIFGVREGARRIKRPVLTWPGRCFLGGPA